MTAPQDPFGTPPQDGPGAPAAGAPAYGAPAQGYGGQPTYGQPAYGQPAYGAPPAAARNGFGVAALVLGILALPGAFTVVFGVLFGVLAIVFGVLGRGRARRAEATNGGLATTGLILGALALVLSIAFVAIGVGLLSSNSGKELQDCVNQAGQDQAAIAQCQRDFQDSISS